MTRPGLLFSTFAAVITKPEPAVALDKPVPPIAGMQPWLFVLAVQYTTGTGGGVNVMTRFGRYCAKLSRDSNFFADCVASGPRTIQPKFVPGLSTQPCTSATSVLVEPHA